MNDRQYEKAYRDAREVLCLRGKTIEKPYQGSDGLRYCRIDGSVLTDIEVFKDAWGDVIAVEILDGRSENQSNCVCCAEGDHLWQEYFIATRQYVSIFTEHHIAASRPDAASIVRLDFLCRQAADLRHRARKALIDHTATHAAQTPISLIMKATG